MAGFGNTGRTTFRRPAAWNVDLSLFKAFPIGRFRPEFRLEVTNIFNHYELGRAEHDVHVAELHDFTRNASTLFGRRRDTSSNTPGPRRMQLGFRFQF